MDTGTWTTLAKLVKKEETAVVRPDRGNQQQGSVGLMRTTRKK